MKKFDVIVIGAGPAGASAAKVIAGEGLEVLIIERQREVARSIQCAEGISKYSLTLFHPGDPRWIAAKINSVEFTLPSREKFRVYYPDVGYILERKIFDRYLVQEAVLNGAELYTGATFKNAHREDGLVTVEYLQGGEVKRVKAPIVIGADGPGSKVGKALGLDIEVGERDVHYCYQYLLAHPSIKGDEIRIIVGHRYAPLGYAWVFPKGEGVANVGLGIIGTTERAKRLLDKFLEDEFPGAKILSQIAGTVPTGGLRMQIVDDNVMLVGDAARLADPLSGGGIPAAMESGKIAGEVAVESLKKGNFSVDYLKKYPERYWQKNRRDYEFSQALRDFFLELEDKDLEYVGQAVKKALGEQRLDTTDTINIARRILSKAPGLLLFFIKKGRKEFGEYLRKVIFG